MPRISAIYQMYSYVCATQAHRPCLTWHIPRLPQPTSSQPMTKSMPHLPSSAGQHKALMRSVDHRLGQCLPRQPARHTQHHPMGQSVAHTSWCRCHKVALRANVCVCALMVCLKLAPTCSREPSRGLSAGSSFMRRGKRET